MSGPTPPTRWATNITRSFKLYGWCARIRGAESGGMVEGLPVPYIPDRRRRRGHEMPDGNCHHRPARSGTGQERHSCRSRTGRTRTYAVFIGAQSLQKPAEYDDADATANANLAARLPYLFATCRFAHYLKCMVRDKIGSFKERSDMERWLEQLDQPVRGRRSRQLQRSDKARKPAGSRRSHRGRGRGQPGLLHLQVLPAPALPTGRADRFAAAGFQVAVRQRSDDSEKQSNHSN